MRRAKTPRNKLLSSDKEKDVVRQCGTMAGNHFLVGVCDDDGCILAVGHAGPHEFVAEDGKHWHWETDMECGCEHCMNGDGDYCIIYWPKAA